ncbi:LysR family transcriptional regulator [Hasllibacter sp. MH4015]|uniref:LysR family transcriptional regulator n=1 Tax=Hasllibacter sp. MH4015 TaxID=2854029 RepID=UPI001CD1A844|nr:LysR family transcriptional regulator [Hasllibacter sp. MH4015]
MDWTGLPYFLAVSRGGSLRAAADALGATHATVDRHLRALEASYGVRLFDRTPKGLVLTQAGETLIPQAEAAEAAVIAARRRVKGLDREASGLIRLTMPPGLAFDVLCPILGDFARTYPEIELDIDISNRIQSLERAEVDVSVRVGFSVDDDVVGRKVVQTASAIYASEGYIARHLDDAGPGGEGLTWLGWGDNGAWVRETPFPNADLRHIVRGFYTQVNLIRAGMGMGRLPVYFQHHYPDLVPVPGTQPWLDRSIWLLLHSDLRRTTRVRLLVDHLAAALRAQRDIFLGPLA